jgi:hypothetical protein
MVKVREEPNYSPPHHGPAQGLRGYVGKLAALVENMARLPLALALARIWLHRVIPLFR